MMMMVTPMQYIFRLVAKFLRHRPMLTPKVVPVDTVTITQVYLRGLPPVLSVYLFTSAPYYCVYDRS